MKPISRLAVAAVLFVQFATLRAAEPGSRPDQPAVRVEKDVVYPGEDRLADLSPEHSGLQAGGALVAEECAPPRGYDSGGKFTKAPDNHANNRVIRGFAGDNYRSFGVTAEPLLIETPMASGFNPTPPIRPVTPNPVIPIRPLPLNPVMPQPPRNPVLDNIQDNYASEFYNRLMYSITAFEDDIGNEKEVGIALINFAQQPPFRLESMGYWNPSLISFCDHDDNGGPVELIQHVSQINVLLIVQRHFRASP